MNECLVLHQLSAGTGLPSSGHYAPSQWDGSERVSATKKESPLSSFSLKIL